ncbi:MAG: PIN domain-containing protein [Patescibacteria group bacterium]
MEESSLPKDVWIVLDTNFLIDFYSKQDQYAPIFEKLRKRNNTIVTIDLVRTEFIRSKSKEVVEAKVDFLGKMVETILPLDNETLRLVQPTIEIYASDMDKVELTDIYLACVIQRHSKVYLLTRNHSDFPCRLFSRSNIFNVGLEKDIKTYALYQYKKSDTLEVKDEVPF